MCLQFCIGFTMKQKDQVKQTCYAKAAQIRAIRYILILLLYVHNAAASEVASHICDTV